MISIPLNSLLIRRIPSRSVIYPIPLLHKSPLTTKHKPKSKSQHHPFYDNQITESASRKITPVTLEYLIELGSPDSVGDVSTLLESSRFLRRELPIRLARRTAELQQLPFIVGVNPWIRSIYTLYKDSFDKIEGFGRIVNEGDELRFTEMLTELTSAHTDVVPKLAKGFLECRNYLSKEEVTVFLDKMIHARIGIRVLAEHHLALHENYEHWIGILNTRLSPYQVIKDVGTYVSEICEINYGSAPELVFKGDVNTIFTYIPVHMEYMMMEVLKNAMRATVEHSMKIGRDEHPPIEVTIARGKGDIGIRVRDQGGGIPYKEMKNAFEYSYTTVPKYEESDDVGIFATATKLSMQGGVGGPMAGLGFGLPMTRIYAKYFGGSFELKSLFGYGCDVFLKLPNISKLNVDHVYIK